MMSMLVRKATLIRPGRGRRGQSQRTSHSSRDTQGTSAGGSLFSRSSTTRSTFTGAFPLRSLLPRTTNPTQGPTRKQSTLARSKASSPSSQPDPERQSGIRKNEETSAQSRLRESELSSRDISQHRVERSPNRPILNTDSHHLLSPPPSVLGRPGLPFRHVGSSLKESDLSKPESDLPFKRSDLPIRHSSLPPRRLDCTPVEPSPETKTATLYGHERREDASITGRHFSLPHRYLDLPRTHLDYPLRRPDSEQAYRELAEREHLHRSLIESVYLAAADARGSNLSGGRADDVLFWESQTDLYQRSDGWRRSSVDQCQRSELLQQILEANKDADGPFDFVCRVTEILSTTVVFTVFLFITLAVPLTMVTMGVKYLDDCPLERRVPVYLLVGGCFLALKLLGMLWKNLQLRRYDSMDAFYDSPDSELAFTSRTFRMMDWILSVFLLAWHVAGACWVFAIWRPAYVPSLHEPSKYCGSSVYLCAVVELIATGGLLVLMFVGCVILALCYKYTTVFEQ